MGSLTYREYNEMMKKHNERLKVKYEMERNVIFNAIINAFRKKNSRVIPLFREENEKDPIEILEERAELFGKNA